MPLANFSRPNQLSIRNLQSRIQDIELWNSAFIFPPLQNPMLRSLHITYIFSQPNIVLSRTFTIILSWFAWFLQFVIPLFCVLSSHKFNPAICYPSISHSAINNPVIYQYAIHQPAIAIPHLSLLFPHFNTPILQFRYLIFSGVILRELRVIVKPHRYCTAIQVSFRANQNQNLSVMLKKKTVSKRMTQSKMKRSSRSH